MIPNGGRSSNGGRFEMWRSFFIAVGIAAVVLGGELLAIDRATLTLPTDQASEQQFVNNIQQAFRTKEFVPPEWAPWTLLSVGAVVVLYSCTVSKE
jgi:hypothetical protein